MKKTSYLLLTTLALAGLNACMPESINNNSLVENEENNINISEGLKSSTKGASLSVSFNFDSFATLASADGTAPARVSDVAKAKLYLTTSYSDPLNSTELKFSSGLLGFSGTSQTYTFGNVPPGGPYFIAVELFDSSDTNIIKPIDYGSTSSTGTIGLTVSSAPVASVTVDNDNKVSTTSAITVFPKLRSGVGATLDSVITPTDGDDVEGSITIN